MALILNRQTNIFNIFSYEHRIPTNQNARNQIVIKISTKTFTITFVTFQYIIIDLYAQISNEYQLRHANILDDSKSATEKSPYCVSALIKTLV